MNLSTIINLFPRRLQLSAKHLMKDSARRTGQQVAFQCNICGHHTHDLVDAVYGRETVSCFRCGSTMRFRAIVHALSLGLFGVERTIPEFAEDKSIFGLGMSDSQAYSIRLTDKFNYINTFYHREPRFDVTKPPDWTHNADFIISSDVLEHVPPPIQEALANLRSALAPNGKLIITVPIFVEQGETVEHFPNLHDFRIEKRHRQSVLVNRTRDGTIEEFADLRFHGGPGATLEMRRFSRESIVTALVEAGFSAVSVVDAPVPRYGIDWSHSFGCPVIATR